MKKLVAGLVVSVIVFGSSGIHVSASDLGKPNNENYTTNTIQPKNHSIEPIVKKSQVSETVVFEDKALETAVKTALGLTANEPVTSENILALTKLVAVKGEAGTISSLKGLEYALNLNTITFTGQPIKDLTPLVHLPLVSIGIAGTDVSDFSPLNEMKLTALDVSYTKITAKQFEMFSFDKSLELLISDNTYFKDISFLKEYTQLRDLRLSNNEIADITPLTKMVNLIQLSLDSNNLTDISPLKMLPKLRYLLLSLNKLTDITDLENLTELVSLTINGNEITSLQPLSELTNLFQINISNNPIQDFSTLEKLTHLKRIDTRNNNVNDLSFVKQLPALEQLDVRNAKVTDVTPLTTLKSLRYLDIADNQLETAKPLEANSTLEILLLTNTGVTDETVPSLPNLLVFDAGYCELSSLSFLKESKKMEQLGITANHIADISILNQMPNLYTLLAGNQIITLAEGKLGTPTELALKDIFGAAPTLDWKTAGSYTDGSLLWENKGFNQVEWTAHKGNFTGTIKQTIID